METKIAHLRTQHGDAFVVKVYNAINHTHFGCSNWRALCKAYVFEPNMLITFDIHPEDEIKGNIDIWVDVQTPPVLPLCKFLNHIYVFDMRLYEPVE